MALREDLVRAYRETLGGLLPFGLAWRRDPESNIGRILAAFAVNLALFDESVRTLIAESDPREALELLEEWEDFLDLPSACTGPLEGLTERRAAIVAKLTREPSASRAFFRTFAERLGYVVEIEEFPSFELGVAGAGDRLSTVQPGFEMGVAGAGDRLENFTDWAHTWAVRSNGATLSSFEMGGSGAGDRLRLVGNALLECSFEEIRPAHTTLLFLYFFTIDPPPARLILGAPAATVA